MAVPISLCVSVLATSEKDAREAVARVLAGFEGVDVPATEFNVSESDIDPDARAFAFAPIDGITVQSCEEYSKAAGE